ncbi:MAG: PhnD/SsuA/transferrin family substrate-binding protein [Magnetococcales bacterium]|nr:PhnD/SsuA/transferrin family substrate-binding protein [Magnetococcales bacterium]
MLREKLSIISLISTLAILPFSSTPALAEEKTVLQVMIRTGDGGQQKDRHIRKLKTLLTSKGCPARVELIKNGAPTPATTDIEFSPEPISISQKRLTNFRLLAQARTIENKTKIGGAIITKKAAGIDDIALLTKKRFSFVSPISHSGYLLQIKMLEEAGVKPDPKQAIFVGNHVGAASMLLHGDTFAATVAAPLARDWLTINKELHIVAQTPLVETGGWWVNRRVNEKQALVCAKILSQIKGYRLKLFPSWVGGFNPQ